MEQYEKETGKYAIWQGKITEGFKLWKKGEYDNKGNKERISVYITNENKAKWQNFAKIHNFSTISKLIREGVDFFINEKSKPFNNILSTLDAGANVGVSHKLKERLTTIKGYLQLILEQYNENLSGEIIAIMNDILIETNQLEKNIVNTLEKTEVKAQEYDILVIEDDLSTINLLKNYFKRKGYSCKGALTGSKGFEELKMNVPKLIILDIILPDISGFDICKILKSDENFKNIKIFYITAIPDIKVKKKIEETKADGYILKPFNLSDLEFLFDYL